MPRRSIEKTRPVFKRAPLEALSSKGVGNATTVCLRNPLESGRWYWEINSSNVSEVIADTAAFGIAGPDVKETDFIGHALNSVSVKLNTQVFSNGEKLKDQDP